jgi:hypothetical protein
MTRALCIPDFTHELRQSAWLAGFIDGEGSLLINRAPKGNHWPTLQVSQRADDMSLMLEIAEALGGSYKTLPWRKRGNENPQGQMAVANKPSLIGAIAYLDAYPLRTKKAAEYVVWRGAVIAYVNEGGWSPMLVEAKARLESLRVYKEVDMSRHDELVGQP